MTTCVALLRGINVGRAKRVPMAELRELFASLGHTGVRTLLNSGNVVFEARRPDVAALARSIAAAIEGRFGFSVPVGVLTAAELDAIVHENRLVRAGNDPAKFLVAFVAGPATLARAAPLRAESWTPEAVAIGEHAVYLWCAGGILESKLAKAFGRLTGDEATTRNWATVLKLQAATASQST